MKNMLFLTSLAFFIFTACNNCTNSELTKSQNNQYENVYSYLDFDTNYNKLNVIYHQYKNNKIIKDIHYIYQQKNNSLDTIVEYTTTYKYDKQENLKEMLICYGEQLYHPESTNCTKTLYEYDSVDRLIKQISFDFLMDTSKVEIIEYYHEHGIEVKRHTKLEKSFFALNNDTVPYDTTIFVIKKNFKDSLRKLTHRYDVVSEKEQLNSTTIEHFNNDGFKVSGFTINNNNDTIRSVLYEYMEGSLIEEIYVFYEIDYKLIIQYDENGCQSKSIKRYNNKEYNIYLTTDENCNILKQKWYE